jgi:hypothetical protein
MREKLTTGSVPFRKAYLQSFVEVDDHRIRIKGSKDVLERAILAERAARALSNQVESEIALAFLVGRIFLRKIGLHFS